MATITATISYDNWVCGRNIVTDNEEGVLKFEDGCGTQTSECNTCTESWDCPSWDGPFIEVTNSWCTEKEYMSIEDFINTYFNDEDELVSVDNSDVAAYLEDQFEDSDCVNVTKVLSSDGTYRLKIVFDTECLAGAITPEDIFWEVNNCDETDWCSTSWDKYVWFDEDSCESCEADCKKSIPVYCAWSDSAGWMCNPLDNEDLETPFLKITYNSQAVAQELQDNKIYYISEQSYPPLDAMGRIQKSWRWPIMRGKLWQISHRNGNAVINVPQLYDVRFNVTVEPRGGIHADRLGTVALRTDSWGNTNVLYLWQNRIASMWSDDIESTDTELQKKYGIPFGSYESSKTDDIGIALPRVLGRMSKDNTNYDVLLPCDIIVPFFRFDTRVNEMDEEIIDLNTAWEYFIGQDVDTYWLGGSPFSLQVVWVGNIVTANKLLKRHAKICTDSCPLVS